MRRRSFMGRQHIPRRRMQVFICFRRRIGGINSGMPYENTCKNPAPSADHAAKGTGYLSRGTTLIPGSRTADAYAAHPVFPDAHSRVTCASRRGLPVCCPSAARLRWEFRHLQEPGKAFSQRPSLSAGKQIPTYIFIAFSNLRHIVYESAGIVKAHQARPNIPSAFPFHRLYAFLSLTVSCFASLTCLVSLRLFMISICKRFSIFAKLTSGS